jgi:uncharacterized membrane protein
VIGFIIVIATKKDDKYAMYYGKQGLVLFIAWIILWIITLILIFIPVIGWIINTLLWIALLILWIFGIIYSLSGEEKPIPIIGSFAKMLKF